MDDQPDQDHETIKPPPTPEDIKELCRQIREEGFTARGRIYPPWPPERRRTRMRPEPVETKVISGFGDWFLNGDMVQ